MANKTTSKKRGVCSDCGHACYYEKHHDPPKCEGGTETIRLCRRCHVARHVKTSQFAEWGRKGGKQTAKNKPYIWMLNLRGQASKLEDYVL